MNGIRIFFGGLWVSFGSPLQFTNVNPQVYGAKIMTAHFFDTGEKFQ